MEDFSFGALFRWFHHQVVWPNTNTNPWLSLTLSGVLSGTATQLPPTLSVIFIFHQHPRPRRPPPALPVAGFLFINPFTRNPDRIISMSLLSTFRSHFATCDKVGVLAPLWVWGAGPWLDNHLPYDNLEARTHPSPNSISFWSHYFLSPLSLHLIDSHIIWIGF